MMTVLATQLVVGAFSIPLNFNSTIATVEQMMGETAVLASERIDSRTRTNRLQERCHGYRLCPAAS